MLTSFHGGDEGGKWKIERMRGIKIKEKEKKKSGKVFGETSDKYSSRR